eukprot:1696708-Amphidinium_carterae.2
MAPTSKDFFNLTHYCEQLKTKLNVILWRGPRGAHQILSQANRLHCCLKAELCNDLWNASEAGTPLEQKKSYTMHQKPLTTHKLSEILVPLRFQQVLRHRGRTRGRT